MPYYPPISSGGGGESGPAVDQTARTAAASARTLAETATTTADNAKIAADTATTTATEAKSAADSAAETASEAFVLPPNGILIQSLVQEARTYLERGRTAVQPGTLADAIAPLAPKSSFIGAGTGLTGGGSLLDGTIYLNLDDLTQASLARADSALQRVPSDVLEQIDAAYIVPAGGIPASTLTTSIRTSLGKADSALQSIPTALTDKVNAAYVKPTGGITTGDLSSSVVTSLGKADSALQSVPAATTTAISTAQTTANDAKTATTNLASSTTTALASKADLVSGKVPASQVAASGVLYATTSGGTATRPTTRTDIVVIFIGPGASPATVTAGQTNGMYAGDIHMVTTA